MKYVWAVLLLLVGVVSPGATRAQASFYGEFSISNFTNQVSTNYLPGATVGFLYDGVSIYHKVTVSADFQGRFVSKNGQSLNGVTIGPRFTVPIVHGFAPYGEFTVGFARYNSPTTVSSTDSTIQFNAGLGKRLSSHLDGVVEYSYSQYYGQGGEYNPKSYSIGAIYHLNKR